MPLTFKRPGIQAIEVTAPTFNQSASISAIAAFVGPIGRGIPGVPVTISSWSDFDGIFGGLNGSNANLSLPFAVFEYFANGGRNAIIVRSLHTSGTTPLAASATLNLQDRAGTPLNTLRVDANSPGVWANQVFVEIVDTPNQSNYFDLNVYYGGTAVANLKERWQGVTLLSSDPRYAPNIINDHVLGSALITVTNLNSATAAPSNNPKLLSPTALAGGVDGGAPSTAELTTAINALDNAPSSPILLNLPGESTTTNVQAAISYCDARGDAVCIVDTAVGLSAAQAVTYANSTLASNSANAAVYWPWVRVADPLAATVGQTRLLPPGGFILGQIATTDAARGVQKAPAGVTTRLVNVLSLETTLTNTDFDNLAVGRVNALKPIPGNGIVVYGARTLSVDQTFRYLPARRTLIDVKASIIALTQFAVFEPNDFTLHTSISGQVTSFLLGFWQAGGLKGQTPQQAFYVKCDEENNDAQAVANGVVNIEVGIALQIPAEFIVLKIGQWNGGTTVDVQ